MESKNKMKKQKLTKMNLNNNASNGFSQLENTQQPLKMDLVPEVEKSKICTH